MLPLRWGLLPLLLQTGKSCTPDALFTSLNVPSPEAHPYPEPYLNLPDPQDPDPRTLLSINSCGLKWHSTPIMATYSAAAGCLYEMCQNTNHMHVISRRLAASRLVPLLQICMEAETDGETAAGADVCAAC